MKKWAVWKTIVCVISAILFVSGATVLGVYLGRGGFGNDAVRPKDLAFVLNEEYDPEKGLEVTDDFSLTITTTTSDANVKQVQLMFGGNVITRENKTEGTITDDVITVPKFVNIGTPFTVKLNRSELKRDGVTIFDGDKPLRWIVGGISNLIAKSANIVSQPVKIAVDVPVYSLNAKLPDGASKVTVGELFSMEPDFFPAASRYAYSNKSVEKKVYYSVDEAAKITANFVNDQMVFSADRQSDTNKIYAYAFKSAKTQNEKISEYISQGLEGEVLYSTVRDYLAASGKADAVNNESEPANVLITEVTITDFTIAPSYSAGQAALTMNADEDFVLHAGTTGAKDNYLGATIGSPNPDTALEMLKNVVVSFEVFQNGQWVDAGNVLSVKGDVDGRTVVYGGKTYYFADTNRADPRYSSWTLNTSDAYQFRMSVALAVKTDDGYSLYPIDEAAATTYEVLINSKKNYVAPTWQVSGDIEIPLRYNETGTTDTLFNVDGMASAGNAKITYFAWFKEGIEVEKILILDRFYAPKQYAVDGGKTLYPLKDNKNLGVRGEGAFDLYCAIVNANSDGSPVINDGVLEVINWGEGFRHVKVIKTLSPSSIGGLTIDGENEWEKNEHYVIAGSDEKIIARFNVEEGSVGILEDQIKAGKISLKIYSGTTDVTNNFEFTSTIEDGNLVYAITSKNVPYDNDTQITALEVADSSSNNTWKRGVTAGKLCVYTPKAEHIEFVSGDNAGGAGGANIRFIDEDEDGVYDDVITITQTLGDKGFSVKIDYIDGNGTAQSKEMRIEEFLQLFSVQITDQHGVTEESKHRLTWSYETDSQVIAISTDKQSFSLVTSKGTIENQHLWATSGEQVTAKLNFTITSTGVTHISVAGDNGSASDNNKKEALVSKVYSVTHTGAENKPIALNDLVNLYVKDATADVYKKFTNFYFTFKQDLDDDDLVNLFGENGMFEVYYWDTDKKEEEILSMGSDASSIRDALSGKQITKLTVKNAFAQSKNLNFLISDATGAVRIDFTLSIAAAKTLTGALPIVGVSDDKEGKVYAANNTTFTVGKVGNTDLWEYVKNNYLADNKSYYIVQELLDACTLTPIKGGTADNVPANAVGKLTENGFHFYDFWDVESKNFHFTMYLDGVENPYALNYPVTFKVTRNLMLLEKEADEEGNVIYDINNIQYNILRDNSLANDKIYKLVRIAGKQEITGLTVKLESTDLKNKQYLEGEGDLQLSTKNIPFFEYGQTRIAQQFKLKLLVKEAVDEYDTNEYIDFANLVVYLVAPQYETIAKSLEQGPTSLEENKEGTHSVVQSVGGVEYLLVSSDTWHTKNSISEENASADIQFVQTVSHDNVTYTMVGRGSNGQPPTIKFSSYSDPLYGLGNKGVYLIAKIHKGVDVYMILPTIVSSAGFEFIEYYDANSKLKDTSTLENALKNPITYKGQSDENGNQKIGVEAYAEEIGYRYVTAGEIIDIVFVRELPKNAVGTKTTREGKIEGGFVGVTGGSFMVSVEAGAGSKSALYHSVGWQDENKSTYQLTLNHLAESEGECYLVVSMSVGISQPRMLYYLLKVEPSAEVNKTYEFDGESEYITCKDGESLTIELNKAFDTGTTNDGQTRFDYELIGEIKDKNLDYTYELVSITDENGIALSEGSCEVSFTKNEKKNEDGSVTVQELLNISSHTNDTIKINIVRKYDGGKKNTLEIVGGDTSYTFTVNARESYAIEYGKVEGLETSKINPNDATWTLSSGATSAPLPITLYQVVGGSQLGTPEGTLKFNAKDEGNVIAITDGKKAITLENGTLSLTLNSYISKDSVVIVYLYTDHGLVGTLTINVSATATMEQKVTDITASSEFDIKDLVTIKRDDEEVENYDITDVTFKDDKGNEISIPNFMTSQGNGVYDVYSIVNDVKLTMTVTIKFNETETFTFDLPITIKANIHKVDGGTVGQYEDGTGAETVRGENVTAGQTTKGEALFDIGNKGYHIAKYSWVGTDAIEEGTREDSPVITTRDVDKEGADETVLIKVELFIASNTEEPYQTFYVYYAFHIECNTRVTINYPNPTGAAEEDIEPIEYLQINSDRKVVFTSAKDFLTGKAVFADGARLVVANANDTTATASEQDFAGKTVIVTIAEISELTITHTGDILNTTDGSNVIYRTADEAKKIAEINRQNLTFTLNRGAVEGSVTFLITAGGFTERYTIVVKEDVFAMNAVAVNPNANGEDVYYIDKLSEDVNIFADGRILEFTLKETGISSYINGTFYLFENDKLQQQMKENLSTGKEEWTGKYIFATKTNDEGKTVPKYTDEASFFNFTLSEQDMGATKYYDLGTTEYKDKDWGVYVKSDKDADGNTVWSKVENIFNGKPSLTSRIKMTYNGKAVNYDKFVANVGFKSNLTPYTEAVTIDGEKFIKVIKGQSLVETESGIESIVEYGLVKVSEIGGDTYLYNLDGTKVMKDGEEVLYLEAIPRLLDARVYTFELTPDNYEDITVVVNGFSFSCRNGQTNGININFDDLAYSYKGELDIEVVYTAKEGGEKTILANQRIDSVIDAHKVRHPSTGKVLDPSELRNGNTKLILEMLEDPWADANLDLKEILGDTNYSNIQTTNYLKAKVNGNGAQYLSYSPVLQDKDGKAPTSTSGAATQDADLSNSDTTYYNVDWRIAGLGAENAGNYVLFKLTYTVTVNGQNFNKVEYLLYKVMPDYVIDYASTTAPDNDGKTDTEGNFEYDVYSNRTSTFEVTANQEGNYGTIQLAGKFTNDDGEDISNNNAVKVYHGEGTTDVAATEFTYTLTVDDVATQNSTTYNNFSNVNQKLLQSDKALNGWAVFTVVEDSSIFKSNPTLSVESDKSTITYTLTPGISQYGWYCITLENSDSEYQFWMEVQNGYSIEAQIHSIEGDLSDYHYNSCKYLSPVWEYDAANNTTNLALNGIAKAQFGSQEYRLRAVDKYGYEFYLHFTLKAKATPAAFNATSLTINEGDYFDIGAVYEVLTIKEVGDKDPTTGDTPIDIESNKGQIGSGAPGYQLINIANLEAWGFDKNYMIEDTATNKGPYLAVYGTNYKLQTGYQFADGSHDANETADKQEDKEYKPGDVDYLKRPNFADVTVSSIKFFYEKQEVGHVDLTDNAQTTGSGEDIKWGDWRDKNLSTTDQSMNFVGDNAGLYRGAEKNYRMPELDSDKYKTSSRLDNVTMVIGLTYKSDNVTETCEVKLNISVNRKTKFSDRENNVVRDGVAFKVADKISASQAGTEITTITYLADTLEVTLDKTGNGSVADLTLSATITREGEAKEYTARLTTSNGLGYATTAYYSLSEALGVTLHEGDQVTIKGISEDIVVRYNGQPLRGEGDDLQYTIRINELNNNGMDTINFVDNYQLKEAQYITKYYLAQVEGKTYQVAQPYIVTGRYTAFNSNVVSGARDVKLEEKTDGIYTIDFNAWSDGSSFETLKRNVNQRLVTDEIIFTNAKLSSNTFTFNLPDDISVDKKAKVSYRINGGKEQTQEYPNSNNEPLSISLQEKDTIVFTQMTNIDSITCGGVTIVKDKTYVYGDFDTTGLTFSISGDTASGAATIDAVTGVVTTNAGFDIKQYIAVSITQQVSGIAGTRFARNCTDDNKYEDKTHSWNNLGEVMFMIKLDTSTTPAA